MSTIATSEPGDILPGDVNNDKDFDYVVLDVANESINVKTTNPEFMDPKWPNTKEFPNIAVKFKSDIYKEIIKELDYLDLF